MTMEPTPEQFAEWLAEATEYGAYAQPRTLSYEIGRKAYQAGADAELEACCTYVACESRCFADPTRRREELRAARRPKPPSLKKRALGELETLQKDINRFGLGFSILNSSIRQALESLPDN